MPLGPDLREALLLGVRLGASDVHLGDGDPPLARIHGDLRPLPDCPAAGKSVWALVEGSLPDAARERAETHGSADFAFGIPGGGRFRANLYRTTQGWALAVRALPEGVGSLEELELPRALASLVHYKDGLVLFTGPTGSGKSSTMAALVGRLVVERRVHVITLEDPIEVLHVRGRGIVRQRELGAHTTSFADGLRAALREDPDVILVGEMRDRETVSLALTAAETGHLVLSTLHCGRTAGAIDRILDVFPEHRQGQVRLQLAESLRAVVAQRLLPRADRRGRIAAIELLRVNHAVANLIRERRTTQINSVIQTHRDEGMWLFERHLAALAGRGLISEDTARAYAEDPGLIESYLAG